MVVVAMMRPLPALSPSGRAQTVVHRAVSLVAALHETRGLEVARLQDLHCLQRSPLELGGAGFPSEVGDCGVLLVIGS